MANYATEADVRLKFQLENTDAVSTALITSSIDAAHDQLLRHLRDEFATASPEADVIRGEVLLAGAHVLRSMASKEASEQQQVSIGGQQVSTNGRFGLLSTAATMAEEKAWDVLAPYVNAHAARDVASATDTVAVLGEV